MNYKNAEKSLRWLANQFPKIQEPQNNTDKIVSCIHLYCENGATAITELLKRTEETEARAENAETRLRYAEECAAALELLLKAIDGEEKLENVTSLAKNNLKKYKEKYPAPKLKFNKQKEE